MIRFSRLPSPISVVALCLVCGSIASADHKPNHKPAGGNGGGGGDGGKQLEFIDLHPASAANSYASAVNNSGLVVGVVDEIGGYWDTESTTPVFSPLPGSARSAEVVNEHGAIAGYGPAPAYDLFYWESPTHAPLTLPLPSGFDNGSVRGISRDGIIVGEIFSAQSSSAAAWRVTGNSVFGPVVISNNSLPNDVASLESGINRIVGASPDAMHGFVATAWDLNLNLNGSFTVASSTVLIPDQTSEAHAITERGDVSGQVFGDLVGANLDRVEDHAFVLRDGSLEVLPAGRRERWGVSYDLNDTDVVGATASYWFASPQAARWNSSNKLENLAATYFDSSWTRSVTSGINDAGDIVGFGLFDGDGRAWLLRKPLTALDAAVAPEPASFALFALGTLILAIGRAQRKG